MIADANETPCRHDGSLYFISCKWKNRGIDHANRRIDSSSTLAGVGACSE